MDVPCKMGKFTKSNYLVSGRYLIKGKYNFNTVDSRFDYILYCTVHYTVTRHMNQRIYESKIEKSKQHLI